MNQEQSLTKIINDDKDDSVDDMVNKINEYEGKTYQGMRVCTKCFRLRHEEEFKKHHLKGFRYICQDCYNIKRITYNKTYYQKVKAKRSEQRRLKKEEAKK